MHDVIISSNSMHRVGNHKSLVPNILKNHLNQGGVFGWHFPDVRQMESHSLVFRAAENVGLQKEVENIAIPAFRYTPEYYVDSLLDVKQPGRVPIELLDTWNTTYHMLLEGDNPVAQYTRTNGPSTGGSINRILHALGGDNTDEGRALWEEYCKLCSSTFPKRADGVTIFPVNRFFMLVIPKVTTDITDSRDVSDMLPQNMLPGERVEDLPSEFAHLGQDREESPLPEGMDRITSSTAYYNDDYVEKEEDLQYRQKVMDVLKDQEDPVPAEEPVEVYEDVNKSDKKRSHGNNNNNSSSSNDIYNNTIQDAITIEPFASTSSPSNTVDIMPPSSSSSSSSSLSSEPDFLADDDSTMALLAALAQHSNEQGTTPLSISNSSPSSSPLSSSSSTSSPSSSSSSSPSPVTATITQARPEAEEATPLSHHEQTAMNLFAQMEASSPPMDEYPLPGSPEFSALLASAPKPDLDKYKSQFGGAGVGADEHTAELFGLGAGGKKNNLTKLSAKSKKNKSKKSKNRHSSIADATPTFASTLSSSSPSPSSTSHAYTQEPTSTDLEYDSDKFVSEDNKERRSSSAFFSSRNKKQAVGASSSSSPLKGRRRRAVDTSGARERRERAKAKQEERKEEKRAQKKAEEEARRAQASSFRNKFSGGRGRKARK